MNKLIVSLAATAALVAGGAAFAEGGDAESQAGSAWRNNSGYTPYGYVVPQSAPNTRPDQGPRNAQEYYGNSGWTPPANTYGGIDAWGRPVYQAAPNAAAVYPRNHQEREARNNRGERQRYINRNAQARDRDGDGVENRRDRYPDDSRRW